MRDAAHQGRHGPRDDALVTLLYDTGLRRAEAVQVNVDMLDLDEGLLLIPPHIQKGFHPDDSPSMNPDQVTFQLDRAGNLRTARTLRAWMNERPEGVDGDALFPSQQRPRMSPRNVYEIVQRLARRADVQPYVHGGRGGPEDVTAHTLRHSLAWRMLRVEEGNSLYDVRNRLRHSSIITTERAYDHFNLV